MFKFFQNPIDKIYNVLYNIIKKGKRGNKKYTELTKK
uniref:Uncharacterized protein n=1 Tax=Podoviridae sp. ctC8s18 TaxID=2827617 RepID=A0A8S5LQM1_9CAUD|nr:MAG TPA: hypothetical protein [Podoviridae sp. ctC8s18]